MNMARKRKETNQNTSGTLKVQTVEEWLAKGNRITVCPPGMRSEDVEYKTGPKSKRGRKKKTN